MTQVTIHRQGKMLTAQLSGEIDHHGAKILREQIDDKINVFAPDTLVLDFAGVTFMDSSGIGLILGRHKLVNAGGGIVIVQKAPAEIRRVLSLAGIDSRD